MPTSTQSVSRATSPHIRLIEIHAKSLPELEQGLAEAENRLQRLEADSGRHGILITRNKPGSYTAELTERVPFGLTREVCND